MQNAKTQALPTKDTISSYDVIQMLLAGGLERIEQAARAFEQGDGEGWDIAISKALGIINGLRMSLDISQGGEIANNLDSLYEYSTRRLLEAHKAVDPQILVEVYDLIEEVKLGWDGISDSDAVQTQSAVA